MRHPVFLVLLLVLQGPLHADDLDELFNSETPDITVPDPELPPPTVPVSKTPPAQPVVKWFGSIDSWVLGVANPDKSSVYFESDLITGLDSRPDDAFRWRASVKTTLPSGPGDTLLKYSPLVVNEAFFDYTALDFASFRVGKFALTWGQARLVDNNANLVSAVTDGASVKAVVPFGNGGLTLVGSGSGVLSADKVPSQTLMAGLVEQTFGPFSLGFSGSHVLKENARAVAYVKTSWAGFDWYGEALTIWDGPGQPYQVDGLAGFLWQGGYPTWTVTGEYQIEKVNDGLDNDDHTLAWSVSIDAQRAWGIKPSLQGIHDVDGSGQTGLALVWAPSYLPHLTVTLGVPWVYGEAGDRLVESNPDPGKRPWSVALKALWSYRF